MQTMKFGWEWHVSVSQQLQQCTTLAEDVDNGGRQTYVEVGVGTLHTFWSIFCDTKTALKIRFIENVKLYLENTKTTHRPG